MVPKAFPWYRTTSSHVLLVIFCLFLCHRTGLLRHGSVNACIALACCICYGSRLLRCACAGWNAVIPLACIPLRSQTQKLRGGQQCCRRALPKASNVAFSMHL